MYGLGATYDKIDMSKKFIAHQIACIGWDYNEAPALYSMLRKVKVSDVIYIKSMNIANKELIIKAVGIVVNDKVEKYHYGGNGINVIWLWNGEEKVKIDKCMYKNNVFNNTLYEEHNLELQHKILELIFNINISTTAFGDMAIKEELIERLGNFPHKHSNEELQEMTIDKLEELLNALTNGSYNPEE